MARLDRKNQKVFAGGAANNGQFGSAQAGTKILSTDLDVLQALAAWDSGWNDATISSAKLPTLEEMQALHFITTRQIAYLFQEGIPEYSSAAIYYQKSIVRKSGTYELYGSKTDDNTGNALPSQTDNTDWLYLGDMANLQGSGVSIGSIVYHAADAEPDNFLECDGSAISRTTYADLFAEIGVVFGVGDGSSTFNLPDLRGEFIRGWDNGRGIDSGRLFGSAQADELKAHTHTEDHTVRNGAGSLGNLSTGSDLADVSQASGSTGGTETRPRNIALLPCIKYQ